MKKHNRSPYDDDINNQQHQTRFLTDLKRGFRTICNTKKSYIFITYLFIIWLICAIHVFVFPGAEISVFKTTPTERIFILATALGAVLVIYFIGEPWKYHKIAHNLKRAGVVNHVEEPPTLRYADKGPTEESTVLSFDARGIPPELWAEKISAIETALNVNVAQINPGDERRHMELTVVPPKSILGNLIEWNDVYIPDNDGMLLLGEGYLGRICVKLDVKPHILIGGDTGSGKTVLVKTLMYQMIINGAQVVVADLKGGADFSDFSLNEYENLFIAKNEEAVYIILQKIIDELERRKKLFEQNQAKNIIEYREKIDSTLPRIFFVVDELAELVDKTGASKEQKVKILEVERALNSIARTSRAYGIHLCLCMQRPDAEILNGQIKNNLNVRICGRADSILSTIVLGDGSADKLIPKSSQGRFCLNDGSIFQGYYLGN